MYSDPPRLLQHSSHLLHQNQAHTGIYNQQNKCTNTETNPRAVACKRRHDDDDEETESLFLKL
jgi:hypothetical protein